MTFDFILEKNCLLFSEKILKMVLGYNVGQMFLSMPCKNIVLSKTIDCFGTDQFIIFTKNCQL